MFKKLQQHWGVNAWQVVLIIATFAIGGSACGRLGKLILDFFTIQNKFVWVVLYILLVTILWPLCVLLISIPLGQFAFFKNYVGKLLKKITNNQQPLTNNRTNIAIFASGAGSNAEKIIEFSKNQPNTNWQVALIVCNKPNAGVLNIAAKHNISTLIINKQQFLDGDAYATHLKKLNIQFIVLAGFLWKVPQTLIDEYPKKIINIHPALLPKYGGKGMYGHYVHDAVIANKEKQSGITIHYVDAIYDHGEIIFKAECNVDDGDTAESLAKKIHALEHQYYPNTINEILQKLG